MRYFSAADIGYLRRLGGYGDKFFISNDAMINLIKEYRINKNAVVLDRILRQCIKLIVFSAKKYKRADIDLGDLVHQGLEGVIEAVTSHYNVEVKEKFITYIKVVVDRRMKDTIDLIYQTVMLPKNISSKLGQILAGTIPIDELDPKVLYSKISVGATVDYKRICRMYSVEESVNSEDKLVAKSLQFDIFRILETVLNRKEHEVLVHSFGLNGTNSKSLDIVSDIVGLTPQAVGALKNRAVAKIQNDPRCIAILSKYLD